MAAASRERDCREWKMSDIDPHDRHTWRSGMRSALHTTNQLLEGGPLMDVPLYLHINQKSNDDDDEEQHDWQRW